jgi:hypothetical protein
MHSFQAFQSAAARTQQIRRPDTKIAQVRRLRVLTEHRLWMAFLKYKYYPRQSAQRRTKKMYEMTYSVTMPLALGHSKDSAEEAGELNAYCFGAEGWALRNIEDLWVLELSYSTEQKAVEGWKLAYETYDYCIGTKDMFWAPTLTMRTQNQPPLTDSDNELVRTNEPAMRNTSSRIQ